MTGRQGPAAWLAACLHVLVSACSRGARCHFVLDDLAPHTIITIHAVAHNFELRICTIWMVDTVQ